MERNKLEFYHTKGKLFLASILSLVFAVFGVLMIYLAYIDESIFLLALALFIIVLFSFFACANILKFFRSYPYITITDEYIQLDSLTKSEVTIYFTDIYDFKVSEVSFKPIVEIVLHDPNYYFEELSFHNKVRLFMNRFTGFTLFTLSTKVVRKEERALLLNTLDRIMKQKENNEISIIDIAQEQNIETDFIEAYDKAPPVNRSIDRSYFLKAYGYSLFLFALSFILFYLLLSRNNEYLLYIIVSFFLYPFARVLIDWLFGFKLRHAIDKQKGVTYYFRQFISIIDFILYYVSIFVAPIGIVFLLIRAIVNRFKR